MINKIKKNKGTGIFRLYPWFISISILVGWLIVLSHWTGGFTSFTTYSFALHKAGPLPREMPDLKLRDYKNKALYFSELRGKYILVDFMYLQCSSICGILRSRLYDYYPKLNQFFKNKLVFLSISFDPRRDYPEVLRQSWFSLGAKKKWIFSSMVGSYDEITHNLAKVGVIRIKTTEGDFNHTALFFLIDPEGNIIAIFDPSKGKQKNLEEIKKFLLEAK